MNLKKEKQAIQHLQTFEPKNEPYYLCYSGGKDSDVILTLAKLAGVKYEAVHTPQGGMILNDDNDDNRLFVEHCYRTTSIMINPIVDWTDNDVWKFLHHYGIKGNPLYEVSDQGDTYCPMGCKRIGCIGCPMKNGKGMKRDLARYPKYRDNYLRAFDRMLRAREEAGLETDERWRNAESVMMWWVGDDPNQMSLFGTPDYLR